ncbi:cytochrome-c oxidase, cbb3-type subunit III [Paraferrimonas sedimenticola]|uniref:Cbb3-type cytochrome c oxidase subunit n=1 Tax=Paraferrimonas sedimenticola TaxID=375674 RepID=A0AA37W1C9_9GAMM|nr:cytochrome-c oxidase, cbb3-type subunit III [Paraferrimonas sedimenticola]GLP96087.1 Cbb3-type cytochrome c oxidase subunit [Paraferrimonas sedimenticola]
MSVFWSWWIAILTLSCIGISVVALYFCLRNNTGVKEGESMGHEFDGIEELNNPLPKWWTYMFVATIIYGLGYFALYPGLVAFGNSLGWASSEHNTISEIEGGVKPLTVVVNQYQAEEDAAQKVFGPIFAAYAEKSVEELAQDPEAIKVGRRLYLQNCALCHGSDAKGAKGFPNIADGNWIWGGSGEEIKTTLMNGRSGMMPPKGGLPITDEEVPALAEYVISLSGREHDAAKAAEGQKAYMKGCFACHGMDGAGNKLLGAPNLTDNAWTYGGSRKAIEESIINGRAGVMPAWKDVLGEEKVHVISSYVYSLNN